MTAGIGSSRLASFSKKKTFRSKQQGDLEENLSQSFAFLVIYGDCSHFQEKDLARNACMYVSPCTFFPMRNVRVVMFRDIH